MYLIMQNSRSLKEAFDFADAKVWFPKSCVLKAFHGQMLIDALNWLSIDTQPTLHWHLSWGSINIPADSGSEVE